MERDSMIIYRSFYEAIKELPKENQAEVWSAVYELGLNGKRINLDGLNKTIFTLIAPQLDANYKKFLNGIKPKQKQTESKTEAKPKQKISKSEANVNVNVNDNEKDIHIYSFFNSLIEYGFNKDLVNDWIQVRKAKKLTNTKTAFDKFIIEVEKCKLDKNEILKTCVEKSWGGFNSNWIVEEKPVYESSDDALYRNVMAQIAKNEQILKDQKNVN
jgi:hypothetical protein